jgi:hypothetical protein
MSMSLLLLLVTLFAATALAFGTVLQLLLGPTRLLIREVLVAALPLYSREFVSVLLLALVLRSAVTMPIKNFFSSSLAPTRSLHHPLTGMSLNCTIPNYPPSPASTCTSLNCNLTLTPHDMPSGLAEGLGHLGHHPDDMPKRSSGHLGLTRLSAGGHA